jgi:hypothetical protein
VSDGSASFNRAGLEEAFAEIGLSAIEAGKLVEIAIYGGSALVLTFPHRAATRDVDAVFHHDAAWLRALATKIADRRGWPLDWLNDGVKGFLSPRDHEPEAHLLFRSYPSEERVGLRVFVASPRYLFAMKCMAMRIGGVEESRDRVDIEALAKEIGVTTSEQALSIVSAFYPYSLITPKTQFGVEEIFDQAASRDISTKGRVP